MTGVSRATSVDQVVEEARKRGAAVHVFGPVDSREAALREVGVVLELPEYYGRNLDALYDCLTDLACLPPGEHVLVWFGPELLAGADPTGYQGLLQALTDAACSDLGRPLSVVLVDA